MSTTTDFVLQQEVLARQSDFFKAALKKEWAKRSAEDVTTVIICMPADYPEVFSIYAEWLYSGAIYSINNTAASQIDTEFKELALAHILGEKLIDRTFKNAIIDAFIEKIISDRTIDPALPVLVYDNTPSPSPLRRLLVDIYVQHGGPSLVTMDRSTAHLAPDFLIEFNTELYNKRSSPATGPIWMQSICARYHEHGKTDFVPCQRRTVMPNHFHPRQHSV